MAIFPSDDPSLTLAVRKRLRPLIDGYSSRFIENVRSNAPTAGASQSRDMWGGRKKFTADCQFDRTISDIEMLMSFWHTYARGFTFFDFEFKQIGSPGYMAPDPLGVGNGVTTQFTAPAKEIVSSGLIAYANAAPVAGVTLSVGTGSQGEDRVVFPSAPANGAVLTVAFLGRRRYTVEIPAAPTKASTDWNRQRVSLTVLELF